MDLDWFLCIAGFNPAVFHDPAKPPAMRLAHLRASLWFARACPKQPASLRNEMLLWTFRWGLGTCLRRDLTPQQVKEVDGIVTEAASLMAWDEALLGEVKSLAESPNVDAAVRPAFAKLWRSGVAATI